MKNDSPRREPEMPPLCVTCRRLWDKAPRPKRAEVECIAEYRRYAGIVDDVHCAVCITEVAS